MHSPNSLTTANEVVAFWRAAGPSRWFRKDAAFDAEFRQRFLTAHEQAAGGALDDWSSTAEGTLALLILLDQFPRNSFRGTARMFSTDEQALAIARRAVDAGLDQQVEQELRNFVYLPFMHSEAMADQERAVALTGPLDAESHKFAILHRDIIARFGRFPHRNAQLGRATTPEEQVFLDEGGFAG